MEENKNFVGYMRLTGNDGDKKVYFDSVNEEEMIKAGFFYFLTKDFKNQIKYLLANPNDGHVRYIEYEEEK